MGENFGRRSPQTELMDEENISFNEFHECLIELEKINVLTLAYRPTLRWIRKIIARADEPVCILDAGSGGGDMLRRIAKNKKKAYLIGVDLNPWSKKSAELVTLKSDLIRFETADIFAFDAGRPVDVIISSLFTHHLNDGQIIHFLKWMDATARRGWLINDLHRHLLPFFFIKYAVRLFSRNRLIRSDAPISVARAFTAADWRRLLNAAGIPQDGVRIEWFFPFRYRLSCLKL